MAEELPLLSELVAVEAKMKKATAELKAIVLARGSHLMDLHGVGPLVVARVLADVGEESRQATSGGDPLFEAQDLRRHLSPTSRRRRIHPRQGRRGRRGSGRALRGVSVIQRGRL